MNVAFGELVEFAVGGGWGEDQPSDGMVPVRVMRGADFPAAESRDLASAPLRYEPSKKAASRILREGDIVLEVSGGTKDRPTGRSIFASPQLLSSVDDDVIPASFCRLVRINRTKASPAFVYYALQDLYNRGGTWEFQNQSTGIANFQFELFRERWRLDLPSLFEQQAIAEVLGALDDKIAANTALAANTASVAIAEYRSAIRDGGPELPIDEVSILLARGITPRYLPDGDGTRVLNQKCVRDQLVSLEPSRWTDDAKVKQEKLLAVGDILVNSTGQGTLGRVARWTLAERATVDSHITIVRPDPDVSDPAVIGQAILAIEADIEALGEGSTGQTELSRIELGRARVRIPSRERAEHLGAKLRALSACQDAARAENDTLTATRDALLPQLMSGKLRVHDAENLIDQAGV
ncbi:restriction endonuclease subunit S [Microbacterium sp. bgisy203]|uniref:restriction endonuclease subunit S n=1 Tax=Microbacterium sp. bgisy203 TaxID=3413799 RepID=UPI003D72C13F